MLSEGQYLILKTLQTHYPDPLTVYALNKSLPLSDSQIRNWLRSLVDCGIVKDVDGGGRKRKYTISEIITHENTAVTAELLAEHILDMVDVDDEVTVPGLVAALALALEEIEFENGESDDDA